MKETDKLLRRLVVLVRYTSGVACYIRKLRKAFAAKEELIATLRAEAGQLREEVRQAKRNLELARELNEFMLEKGMDMQARGYTDRVLDRGTIDISYQQFEVFHPPSADRKRAAHGFDMDYARASRAMQAELLRTLRESISDHIMKGFFEAIGETSNAAHVAQKIEERKARRP